MSNQYKLDGSSYKLDLDENAVLNRKNEVVATYEIIETDGEHKYDAALADEDANPKVIEAVQNILDAYLDEYVAELEEEKEILEEARAAGELPKPKVDVPAGKKEDELTDLEFASLKGIDPPKVNMALGDKTPAVMRWRKRHRPALFKEAYGIYGEVGDKKKHVAARKTSMTTTPDVDEMSNRSFD